MSAAARRSDRKVEQQLSAGLREGQIDEFVENDEVEARKIVGEPPLSGGAPLGI
jgi:hypothetical protein